MALDVMREIRDVAIVGALDKGNGWLAVDKSGSSSGLSLMGRTLCKELAAESGE